MSRSDWTLSMCRAAAQRSLSEGMGVAAVFAGGVAGAGPRLQVTKRSMMSAISRAVVGGDGALGGAVDLLIEQGVFEAESLRGRAGELAVNGVEAEVVDDQVGSAVVADRDHEGERVIAGEGVGRVQKEENAGAGDLVFVVEHETVVEMG